MFLRNKINVFQTSDNIDQKKWGIKNKIIGSAKMTIVIEQNSINCFISKVLKNRQN